MMDKKHEAKTLTQMLTESLAIFTNAEGRARYLRHKTTDMIQRLKADQRIIPAKSEAAAEMADYDITLIHTLSETLDTMAREQWRQREAIKLFLHGQIDCKTLQRISETWNGDTL